MSKGFPQNLFEKDLLALYNILQVAKGNDREKKVKELFIEVRDELQRRLNDTENNDTMSEN